jgi:dCTP deaminase
MSLNNYPQLKINCGYILRPDEFILASTNEIFNLPDNISAEYKLKSTQARNAMEHLNAGFCDPGWNNSKLTLELKNVSRYHKLIIRPNMPCGQIVFFRHEVSVPSNESYAVRGQYNNQTQVTLSKGLR